ncbi:LmeA family phospholipid-binding protein [Longispora albida]|uniref:LmeA family phospholipid-binding protein n=1 Tax=Longispora albida TaxID=203523 RepID=UPI00035C4FE9|nr:DUF2993 domain-containing protein [Longispora albida]
MNKAGKITIAVVLTLGILTVAADRVLAVVAEDVLTDQVSTQLKGRGIEAKGEPDVAIGGFPFLTQVVGGEFDEVTIGVGEVRSTGVAITDLEVKATGVRTDLSAKSATAGVVSATGTVPYASVAGLLGQPDLTVTADNGKLKLRTTVRVAGQPVVVLATGAVTLSNGRLKLVLSDARPESGTFPAGSQRLVNELTGRLSQEVPLPALPYSLTLDKLEVTDGGLRVSASARNVPLSG